MRQRFIVATKLVETVGRGVFVVLCTYRLPLVEAGQFGILVTVVSLAAFALGYERQVDLLRTVSGLAKAVTRERLNDTLRFQAVHGTALLTVAALTAAAVGAWSAATIGGLLVIVIAEHLSGQAYQAVLIERSNFALLVLVALKNLALAVAAGAIAWLAPDALSLTRVLVLWIVVSVLFIPAIAALWTWHLKPDVAESWPSLPVQSIAAQYHDSRVHFIVGLVAVAAIQIDRLVVSVVLLPVEVGVFFRNVTITALVLQIFNIASFSRIAPSVYALVRQGGGQRARRILRAEFLRFAILLLVGYALALAMNHLAGLPAEKLGVQPIYLAVLGTGVLLRAGADFGGLLLLAQGADGAVLRNQLAAVTIGGSALLTMAASFGLEGAIAGSLVTSSTYFVLNRIALARHLG